MGGLDDSLVPVAVTAALISAAAFCVLAGVAWLLLRRRLRRAVGAYLDEAGREVEARARAAVGEAAEEVLPSFRDGVREGFEEAGEAMLPRVRTEVEAGFRAAAESMLPRFRAEVRDGFREALGPGLLSKAGEELARKGSSVLEAGLETLFGGGPRRPGDDNGAED